MTAGEVVEFTLSIDSIKEYKAGVKGAVVLEFKFTKTRSGFFTGDTWDTSAPESYLGARCIEGAVEVAICHAILNAGIGFHEEYAKPGVVARLLAGETVKTAGLKWADE